MGKITYHDHDGNYMSQEDWQEKQKDEQYRYLHRFDNGKVRAFAVWDGVIEDAADSYRDMWKLFHLEVWNYEDGKMSPDPVEHMESISTLEEVEEWWRDFLSEWTDSEVKEVRNSKGAWVEEFVEEKNTFGGGSSADLAVPQTQSDEDVW